MAVDLELCAQAEARRRRALLRACRLPRRRPKTGSRDGGGCQGARRRRNAAQIGLTNVEFRKGYIEEIPLADASVDVVISNCVLNLSTDKPRVLREAARVLRPGGRFAISDVLADADMDATSRADMARWTGCIAGALTREQLEEVLSAAGLSDITISETHRVHEHAGAAMIRAAKPDGPCE